MEDMDINRYSELDLPLLANEIARSYNILSTYSALKNLYVNIDNHNDVSNLTKYKIHCNINDFLFEHHFGEIVIKGLLVKEFNDQVFAFEVPTITSRLDFLIINGHTNAFEIKSKLDKLDKIVKQIDDYQKVFEYVNLVVDPSHLSEICEIIPEEIGIYIYESKALKMKRIACSNKSIDPESQLNIFTKKELKQHFNRPKSEVLSSFSPKEINQCFRLMLKERYADKANFLIENIEDILPIDYQYFFKHNIEPSIIYSTE